MAPRCKLESIPPGTTDASKFRQTMKAHKIRHKPTRKATATGTSLHILDKKYTKIAITGSNGKSHAGWLQVSISATGLYFYLSMADAGRAYWLHDPKLKVQLCEENKELRLSGYKIVFEKQTEYDAVAKSLQVHKELVEN